MQQCSVGDQQITLGSLEEDSVAQEGDGSNEKRFEDKSMKRSFFMDKESTLDLKKEGLLTQREGKALTNRSASDFGKNYLNYLKGEVVKKTDSDSDLFQSDDCDEKRCSYTP